MASAQASDVNGGSAMPASPPRASSTSGPRAARTHIPAAMASRRTGVAASSAVGKSAIRPRRKASPRAAAPASGITDTRSRSALGTAARVRWGVPAGPMTVMGPDSAGSVAASARITKRRPVRSRSRATTTTPGAVDGGPNRAGSIPSGTTS